MKTRDRQLAVLASCDAANARREAEQRTRIGNTPAVDTDGQAPEAERLLAVARAMQTAFWDAIRELEEELDIEIDSNIDLEDVDLDDLREGDGLSVTDFYARQNWENRKPRR